MSVIYAPSYEGDMITGVLVAAHDLTELKEYERIDEIGQIRRCKAIAAAKI